MTVVHTGKHRRCRARTARKYVCLGGLHLNRGVWMVVNSFARFWGLLGHVLSLVLVAQASIALGQIDLPTSKRLAEPVPGAPQRLNSLPMTAAISPDGRYLAVVNAGYGTFESRYQQSIAVLDIQTGKVTDFPEPRTATGLPQTLYSGLAFGKDG
ncbi:MAG: hypothetical protein QOH35_3501, partial [Acidobacteriaceae bacterium]|nr:hypothetical protein [Acidobacteriaceae bacterium]